ncbi:hypothetical protein BABINDRAFT_161425 [Babjeviella inositovora NRRL Y-12698]|uniref:Uncharacterized protein n=1 Tax=Babjeviella inositovora NRRL Y-12698 TaxID=984486 RepID=A0A1E3QPT8_9ASCO|nr:uncharacterized protein BABINDRAFT_161425 [Babjeviella inositovora NRRL Y-12698]ODQ79713.1 hypothetical protein BABINDRAFT_161425 [Babjeviella inositovora NRRL Y-12698]
MNGRLERAAWGRFCGYSRDKGPRNILRLLGWNSIIYTYNDFSCTAREVIDIHPLDTQ